MSLRTDSSETAEPMQPTQNQSWIDHLLELRNRLLHAVLVILVIFLPLALFAGPLYSLLAQPMLDKLPDGVSMIATDVAAPFLAPFKLSLVTAIFAAVPYLLYQLWAFVAPGLYAHEKRLVVPLVVSSTLLFYCGIAFAWWVVFPLVFQFFINAAPEGVTVMTDISSYLDFVLKLFIAFGLAFEVPVATVLLVATGATDVKSLANKRPYVFLGAFVLGMLLTPPDVISQILLALPMYLLFEVGILMSRWLPQKTDQA